MFHPLLFFTSFCCRNEKYGGVKNDHLIFNKQKDNRLCDELKNEETRNSYDKTKQGFLPRTESQGRFQIEIKTGFIFNFSYSLYSEYEKVIPGFWDWVVLELMHQYLFEFMIIMIVNLMHFN